MLRLGLSDMLQEIWFLAEGAGCCPAMAKEVCPEAAAVKKQSEAKARATRAVSFIRFPPSPNVEAAMLAGMLLLLFITCNPEEWAPKSGPPRRGQKRALDTGLLTYNRATREETPWQEPAYETR